MKLIIEAENYPTLDEVKEILIKKGWNFNKGRVPNSYDVLLTTEDEDIGGGIIMGRFKNGLTIYTRSINDKVFVVSYAPFNPRLNTDDLSLGLIDRGYRIRIED